MVCHAVEGAAAAVGKAAADDLFSLKGEITYSHAPLAEALERVGKREAGPLGQLFTAAAEGICRQEGESLQEIWRREVQVLSCPKIRLPLTEEDLEQLAGLGAASGISGCGHAGADPQAVSGTAGFDH